MKKTEMRRIIIVTSFFVVVFVCFALRLVDTQIVKAEYYSEQANLTTNSKQTVTAARGEIVDRYGRPMVVNRTGFNVIFDKAFFPRGQENEIILRLIAILQQEDEAWIDNLPITREPPFQFKEGERGAVARLKRNMGVADYATVENVFDWLIERYDLQEYSPRQQRLLAGVRYEMDQRQFSYETPYTFAEDVDIDTITRIKELSYELPGVDVQESSIRQYVDGDIAPHILGRIGPIYAEEMSNYRDKGYKGNEMVGKDGLERAFEDQLRGKDGQRQIIFQGGVAVDVKEIIQPQPGNTLVLTIDKKLQQVAQEALEAQIKTMQNDIVNYPPGKGHEAEVGAVVAIDPRNGEILVMASYPGFNLETYFEDYEENAANPLMPFFNRALNGSYAPGSTFKPVVATAGLNEGIIERNTHIYCGRVYTYWNDYQPTCLGFHGDINVMEALQHSCNIFFYETGRLLGIDKIDEYAKMYGLGEPTGIELRENVGHRASPETTMAYGQEWNEGDVVQAAIGQNNNSFSLLQLCNYTATIANGGKRMKAHLVKNIVSYDFEQTIQENGAEIVQQLSLNEGVLETVVDGMKLAAGPAGTSLGLFNDYPFEVAAKTGTPQTSSTTQNSVYICFAPAEDPEIAIAVIIEDGWHGYTGTYVAKAIMDQYFFANANAQKPQQAEVLLS